MGQLVLGVAGAVVGSFFGQPQIGYAVGSLLGAALFPEELPAAQGPRQGDLKVQVSTYGKAIPILYGQGRIAGNVIWSADRQEHAKTETQGGKGGPTQEVTTYTYTLSFAVSLCEGVVAGIGRIWANGKLVYNANTATIDAGEITGSAAFGDAMTLYLGNETQLADPTIESYLGAGNVPGYRGQAYIVFTDLDLTPWGGQLPSLSFEVFKQGAASLTDLGDATIPNSTFNFVTGTTLLSATEVYAAIPRWNSDYSQWPYLFDIFNASGPGEVIPSLVINTGVSGGAGTVSPLMLSGVSDEPATSLIAITYQTGTHTDLTLYVGTTASQPLLTGNFGIGASVYIKLDDVVYICALGGAIWSGAIKKWSISGGPSIAATPAIAVTADSKGIAIESGVIWQLYLDTGTFHIVKFDAVTFASLGEFASFSAGSLIGSVWGFTVDGGIAYILTDGRIYQHSGAVLTLIGLHGAPATFALGETVLMLDRGLFIMSGHNTVSYAALSFAGQSTTLSAVVTDLCGRGSLTPADLNVTELTDTVVGYQVGRQTEISAAIGQLATTYRFDAVESDGQIKFPKRGRLPALSIPLDDLVLEGGR